MRSPRNNESSGRLFLSPDERREAIRRTEERRADRTPRQRPPERRAVVTPAGIDFAALRARAKVFFRSLADRFSVSRENVVRAAITAALLILFVLIQTTIFTRLSPFGAVPDLMLSFCIAVAVTEGERWGAVVALFAALTVTAMGSVSFDPAPVLYFACAYTAGYLSRYVLKQNIIIRGIYTFTSLILRAIATLIAIASAAPTFTFALAMRGAILPEAASTLVCAPFVHLIVWASLHAFHRSRAQRTGDV